MLDEKLGEFTGKIIDLKLKEGAKSIFMKPRPVPFAFKKQMNDEFERLEKEKIITKIDNSEWGTPLVPILKPDGTLRACVD